MNQPNPTNSTMTDQPHSAKRLKLSLKVALEAGADGRIPVHQVFPDGSYIPAVHSHFERTSAAASAFVARALAPQQAVSVETRATDNDPSPRWAAKAVTDVEGALYELGRAIAVIEALRLEKPLLELRRTTAKKTEASGSVASNMVGKDAKAILMAKRRAMTKCADLLAERTNALEKWVESDNIFCDSFLQLRKRCGGVRRKTDGTPLIDVGDADFLSVLRPLETNDDDEERPTLRIQLPATTYLRFGLHSVEDNYSAYAAPVASEGSSTTDNSVKAVIRRIRLSRISSSRRRVFDLYAQEVAPLPHMTELTSNSLGLESGPTEVVRMEKTQRADSAPPLDIGADPTQPPPENFEQIQTASLLQIIASHACISKTLATSPPKQLLDRLLAVSTARTLLRETEAVLDAAVKLLRIRLEWSRGPQRAEEARARVYSTEADGDGPTRALATIEPVTGLNNAGEACNNGHVRIIPAFGVTIPAPDDPSARGRPIPPHTSTHSNGVTAHGPDDVPRAYICPVGGEILSVLTLLLCIRLLDGFETAARAGVEDMLDVDRQCFTVIVSSPSTGRTLRAKAWPKGPGVGREVPEVTVSLDGKRIEEFPTAGPGRLNAWRELLNKLVTSAKDVKEEENPAQVPPVDATQAQPPVSAGFGFDQQPQSDQYRFDL